MCQLKALALAKNKEYMVSRQAADGLWGFFLQEMSSV
jgi:hypothetical protein